MDASRDITRYAASPGNQRTRLIASARNIFPALVSLLLAGLLITAWLTVIPVPPSAAKKLENGAAFTLSQQVLDPPLEIGSIEAFEISVSQTSVFTLEDPLIVTSRLPIGVLTPTAAICPGWQTCQVQGNEFSAVWHSSQPTPTPNISPLVISFTVGPLAFPEVVQTATLIYVQEGSLTSISDKLEAPVAEAADLSIRKSVFPAIQGENGLVTFTLQVVNQGVTTSSGTMVVDNFPAGLSFAGDPILSQGEFIGIGRLLVWQVGDLPLWGSAQITVPTRLEGGTLGSWITNTTASLTSDLPDWDQSDNQASAAIHVQASADLQVKKYVTPTLQKEDGLVRFTVHLYNYGPNDATNVVVTDSLPISMTLAGTPKVSFGQAVSAGQKLVWSLNLLTYTASASMVYTASIKPDLHVFELHNQVCCVSLDQYDWNPMNNSASATVIVTPIANMAVSKAVSPAFGWNGDSVTFNLLITNTGPSAVMSITLTDTMPAGVKYLSSQASSGQYISATGIYTLQELQKGESVSLRITGLITAPGLSDHVTVNQATVKAYERLDPNPLDDLAQVEFVINPTQLTGQVRGWDPFNRTYIPLPKARVWITDAANQFFSTETDSAGIYTFTYSTSMPMSGPVFDVYVSMDERYQPSRRTISITHGVSNRLDLQLGTADLWVFKSSGNAEIQKNQQVLYTLTLINFGDITATDVLVTDQLPAELSLVNSSFDTPSYDPHNRLCTWTLPAGIPPNSYQALTLTTRLSSSAKAGQWLTNTVWASTAAPEFSYANNHWFEKAWILDRVFLPIVGH